MKTDRNKFSGIRSLVIVLILLFFRNTEILSQETPSTEEEFPIGAFLSILPNSNNQLLFQKYNASGMNTIVPRADDGTKDYLNNLSVIPWNQKGDQWGTDWIQYYITGFYSKWEAEENQLNDSLVGVKHTGGQQAVWEDTVDCWSSAGLSDPQNSIMYGPDYHQEKVYRRFLVNFSRDLEYTPRIRMALNNPEQVSGNEEVCRIKVVHRYKIYYSHGAPAYRDTVFLQRTLKVSDFNTDGSFSNYYFHSSLDSITYRYDTTFHKNETNYKMLKDNIKPILYSDIESLTGIQFCVDWLRDDTLCTLYIDYAEVYDNEGWNEYIEPLTHNRTISRITDYTQSYTNWDNIKYWYGHDEPYTIDAIVPMKVVDQIVRSAGGAPVVTAQLIAAPEHWSPTNGIWLHQKIYEEVQPAEVMFDYYPFYKAGDTQDGLEILRTILEETHRMKPGFWYIGQAFGTHNNIGEPCMWRTPDTTEVKASIMLSLSHGTKGILFWNFESGKPQNEGDCYRKGILDTLLNETDFFYLIKNNLAPRLKGKLGNTLLGLDYSGVYLQLKHLTTSQNPIPEPLNYEYLTIGLQSTNHDMNWHVGFFNRTNHNDDKYFFMANLWTNSTKQIQVRVTPPVQGYTNYRFRNMEPENNFDVTFTTQSENTLTFPAGEGYLFEVAPVVKYGGKLIANETAGNGMTLYDAMTIESGATLTIDGVYNSIADITIKSGGKIETINGGTINFIDGCKLVIDGYSQLTGTEENRLTLQFNSATVEGVVVKQGASLIMSYCDILDSQTGIKSEPGAGNISISNVNISNCSNYGIALLGSVDDDGESTPPPPTIFECNISGSSTGINVVNYNEILIKSNTIENSDVGISLTQIPSAYIQGNIIIGGAATDGSGILMASCGGYIRTNTIRNHVNAIYLGNSSPAIGGNLLELNLHHGIYVGVGSVPDLTPSITGEPPLLYPASGYNKIKNNGQGGIGHLPDQNDGSEIYINNSNMLLRSGCNEIMDDRPSIPPLNTLLLMNGTYRGDERELNAEYNYWGTTEPTQDRFGDLEIIFYPYYAEVCPFPQKGNDDFVARTSSGEVVDTLPIFAGSVNLSSLELSYAQAGKYYLSGNYEQAKTIYNQIVQAEYTSEEKLTAYYKLYTIGNLLNEDEQYFSDLQSAFNSISNSETDSLLITIYNHNSLLCDVSKEAYVPAITGFDNIIQQNPETEEALFAEIDILTTALKIDTTNNQLGKMVDGKYLLKNSGDYLSRMKTLMQDNFGIKNKSEDNFIPTEYSLYQNYPNPFNPSTTIKFDLPKDGNVELIVYDILGRKIIQLVNEYRSAGSYEHRFDATNLASGIYLYQLKSGDFISTKKMMLVK